MSKTERYFQLKEELKVYIKPMFQASEIIFNEGVSKYPIFVAHQQEVSIGLPIIEKEKTGGLWSIHASTLEEFVAKNIVFSDKIEEFKDTFKDPEEFVCVFVLSELGAKFVFFGKSVK